MFGIIAQNEVLNAYASTQIKAGMLHARSNVLTISSSVDSYPSMTYLVLEQWTSAPAVDHLDSWDAAAELSYTFMADAQLAETYEPPALSTMDSELSEVLIPAGTYRFRAFARKHGSVVLARPEKHIERDPTFDENDELITEDRLEEVLVQYWPAPRTDGGNPVELKAHEEYPPVVDHHRSHI